MNTNAYQVATTTDPTLPFRKWNHQSGYVHAVSALSAAYEFQRGLSVQKEFGNIKDSDVHCKAPAGVVYKLTNGLYVSVGFGYGNDAYVKN